MQRTGLGWVFGGTTWSRHHLLRDVRPDDPGAIAFVKTNFNIDIVEIAGSNGLYKGQGNSVYFESDGARYQTSATIDGDSLQASINLMKVRRNL